MMDCSNQEVQVEFEARMIDETDFHGIRRLLQQVIDQCSVAVLIKLCGVDTFYRHF